MLAALGAALCVFLSKSDPRLRHLLWLLVLARLAVPFDLQSPAIESGLLSGDLARLALFANPEKPVNLGRSAAEVLPARPTSGEGWSTRAPRAKLAQPSTYSGAIEGTGNMVALPKLLPLLRLGGIATFGLLHWMRLRATRFRISKARPVDRLSSFSRALATDLGLKKEIPILR